jgi:16S rRNA processing protein RimM
MVTIGRLVRPQGRKGEVIAEPLTDRPDRLPSLRTAYVAGPAGSARELTITGGWPHKDRYVLKFEGIDSIDAAETLRGLELRIGEEELAALPPGEYYHHQLRDLKVEDPVGRPVGVVADILETGAAPVLVVRGGQGEVLIPLAEDFVKSVDLAAGRLVAVVPELVSDGAGD